MTKSARIFLDAARVPATLQPQSFGLWTIERRLASQSILGEFDQVGWPEYTLLRRVSARTLHLEGAGEVVMEDSRRELSRHLPIWLAAYGRVLVSGLGLGCVVRGLLASDEVAHIDVVEIDKDILRVVGAEFSGCARVSLHHGDALTIDLPGKWYFAWHDLWTDGDEHLQILHAKLIKRYWGRASVQGAWQFPRLASRRLPPKLADRLIGIPRSRAV
jgi:hypothetical protein